MNISWQNRLILCLGLEHFMTTQTDTMSEIWIFHDKTDWYYVWGLSISSQNRLILCLRFDHFMTKQTDTMSGAWPFHDITDSHYLWGFTISWQNRLILCLGIDHFMTKHTDSMSGSFMCNGQITTRTHDSMINTHAHGYFEFYVRF